MDEVFCSRCRQSARFKCERCLEPYCSSQCQVNDWQDHKPKCYKFPNLIPINILRSLVNNLSLDTVRGNQHLRSWAHDVNETRRASVGLNNIELLKDDECSMVSKATCAASEVPIRKASCEKLLAWRVAFPPSNGFFDALVQFKEESENVKNIVWITDVKYDSSLRKLLAEINRTINQSISCSCDDIYEGALIAAPFEDMLYRAEILENFPDLQKATVRLIDYGNKFRVSYSQLFAPIPIMCNLNAYAFRVCLPNDYGPVEIESILTIRIVGEKQPENYYNVEFKMSSIPLQLPIELLNKDHIVKFVKIFPNGHNALLRLCVTGIDGKEFNNFLNSAKSLCCEFESLPKVTEFVAAHTQYGWKRARILGFYEEQHLFLIYAIDEGIVCFSPHIKRIPESFVTKPVCVFAISTKSTNKLCEKMLTTAQSLSLQLLPSTSAANKESKTQLPCGLFAEKQKMVDMAIASVFTGLISDLGLKLWYERIPEGDTVIVSRVLTHKEIYIASQQNREYPKILMSEYSKCIPFASDETIKKADIVMYCINKKEEATYCRGQVIDFDGDLFKVLDIDSGFVQILTRQILRQPTIFAHSLPVRCYFVKLMFLENIPILTANNKALVALEKCVQNAVEFDVTFGENEVVDLLFRTKAKESLCKKLLPMVYEPAINETPTVPLSVLPENLLCPLSPPKTPITFKSPTVSKQSVVSPEILGKEAVKKRIFTIDDIKTIPLTCGDNTPLYVLDPSTILNMECPYITAADYNNKEFLVKMEQYLGHVAEYCKSDRAPKNGYAPKNMEVCLSVYADDGEWYRALCLEQKSNDIFVVLFLDYGNVSEVSKMDIMPIIPDLMFPSNANMVYVEGITSKDAIAFEKGIKRNPIIYANVRRLDGTDAYEAKLYL